MDSAELTRTLLLYSNALARHEEVLARLAGDHGSMQREDGPRPALAVLEELQAITERLQARQDHAEGELEKVGQQAVKIREELAAMTVSARGAAIERRALRLRLAQIEQRLALPDSPADLEDAVHG